MSSMRVALLHKINGPGREFQESISDTSYSMSQCLDKTIGWARVLPCAYIQFDGV
jgi:hypothetical protein